jgi:hypothetical protein
MDRLELPNRLHRTEGRLHSSTDEQNFQVRIDSFHADRSFKHLGKEKVVSVYTFRNERNLL